MLYTTILPIWWIVQKKMKKIVRATILSSLLFVSQLTPIGTTVFKGVKAVDADAGVNGMVEYFVVPGDGENLGITNGIGKDRVNVADGYGFFAIPLPHQGGVTVNRSLDYEKTQRYLVTIVASVST
jgi:protocadherin-15